MTARIRWVAPLVAAASLALQLSVAATALAATTAPDIQVKDASGTVSPGTTVSAIGDRLTITADVPAFWSGQLALQWPVQPGQSGDASCVLGRASAATSPAPAALGPFTLDTRSFAGAAGGAGSGTPDCAQSSGPPAINGPWQIVLTLSNAAGQNRQETFPVTLATPPAPVSGVAAGSSGMTVTVTWQPGAEPDLTGYDLLTASDEVVASGITPSSACAASACSGSFEVSAPGSYSFVVRSERSTSPGSSATIASADSQPANVVVSAPSGPSAEPGTGAATRGSGRPGARGGTGGSTTAIFRRFVAGVAAAPPPAAAPGADMPAVAAGAPDSGGYALTLPYGSLPPASAPGGPAAHHTTARGRAAGAIRVDAAQLAKPAAGSLILLLLAAHLAALLRISRLRPRRRLRRRGLTAA